MNAYECFTVCVQQGEDQGKGDSDGTRGPKTFFSCPRKSGIFVPFSSLRTVIPRSPSPGLPLEPVQLSAGDRVTYSTADELRHGMVLGVRVEKDGHTLVQISTVSSQKPRSFIISGSSWSKADTQPQKG